MFRPALLRPIPEVYILAAALAKVEGPDVSFDVSVEELRGVSFGKFF